MARPTTREIVEFCLANRQRWIDNRNIEDVVGACDKHFGETEFVKWCVWFDVGQEFDEDKTYDEITEVWREHGEEWYRNDAGMPPSIFLLEEIVYY